MNEGQIIIGNRLLELFKANNGRMNENTYLQILKNEFSNVSADLINTTAIIMIEDYSLIRRNIADKSLKFITADGYRANRIGLKQFIIEFEEQKELEKENLKANIKTAKIAEKNSRKSLTISIFALIAAVFAPILATIVGFYIEKNDSEKSSNNSRINNIKENIVNCDTVKQNISVHDSINLIK